MLVATQSWIALTFSKSSAASFTSSRDSSFRNRAGSDFTLRVRAWMRLDWSFSRGLSSVTGGTCDPPRREEGLSGGTEPWPAGGTVPAGAAAGQDTLMPSPAESDCANPL